MEGLTMSKSLSDEQMEFVDYVASNVFDRMFDEHDSLSDEVWLAIFEKVASDAEGYAKATRDIIGSGNQQGLSR
jgi:hypothetical protein